MVRIRDVVNALEKAGENFGNLEIRSGVNISPGGFESVVRVAVTGENNDTLYPLTQEDVDDCPEFWKNCSSLDVEKESY